MVLKLLLPPNAFNKTFVVHKPYILIRSEPLHPITGDRPHWVLTHKTFTKWENVPLNGAHIINDVEKDLDDRIVLIALLEALRKQKISFMRNKNPKVRLRGWKQGGRVEDRAARAGQLEGC